jgi:hypothetical protein
LLFILLIALAGFTASEARAAVQGLEGALTSTGKRITPAAAPGAIFQNLFPRLAAAPDIHANNAAATAISPDGKVLAILTSGNNLHYTKSGAVDPGLSTEYVFLFDVTGPRPRQLQVLRPANTYMGLAWAPTSDALYVSGGKDDLVTNISGKVAIFPKCEDISLAIMALTARKGPRLTLFLWRGNSL